MNFLPKSRKVSIIIETFLDFIVLFDYNEKKMEREFGVLEEIWDNYPQYVVSLDEFDRGRNGIRHRNIRDFLLEKSWT